MSPTLSNHRLKGLVVPFVYAEVLADFSYGISVAILCVCVCLFHDVCVCVCVSTPVPKECLVSYNLFLTIRRGPEAC